MAKNEVIHLRLSCELLEALRKLAQIEMRPLSKQVELLLKKALEEK